MPRPRSPPDDADGTGGNDGEPGAGTRVGRPVRPSQARRASALRREPARSRPWQPSEPRSEPAAGPAIQRVERAGKPVHRPGERVARTPAGSLEQAGSTRWVRGHSPPTP